MGSRTGSIYGIAIALAVCCGGCDRVSQYWSDESADDADADLLGFEVEPTGSTLDLNLAVGDRFPLLKTVEQTLTQQTPAGPSLSRSTLELLLAIEVEEVRDGNKRLGVRYHRVRYRQDIAGEQVEYDSEAPPHSLPAELQIYAGLLDNGFSFWIDADNQISELVGFNEFLTRCVRMVPPGPAASRRHPVGRDFGRGGDCQLRRREHRLAAAELRVNTGAGARRRHLDHPT